jgi:Transcription elongation factor, N-terminal
MGLLTYTAAGRQIQPLGVMTMQLPSELILAPARPVTHDEERRPQIYSRRRTHDRREFGSSSWRARASASTHTPRDRAAAAGGGSYGDGSTNDEYHAVRDEQVALEARMASLEQTISRATVIDPDDGGTEQPLGSTVSIEDLAAGMTSHLPAQ